MADLEIAEGAITLTEEDCRNIVALGGGGTAAPTVISREITFDGQPATGAATKFATTTLIYDGTPPTDGDTVTIGSITYTFRDAPSELNDVSTAASNGPFWNLFYALTGQGTSGFEVGIAGSINPDVTEPTFDGISLLGLRAATAGASGNFIPTASSTAHFTFDNNGFSGGQDGTPIPLFTSVGETQITIVGLVTSSLSGNTPGGTITLRSSGNAEILPPIDSSTLGDTYTYDVNGAQGGGYTANTVPGQFLQPGQSVDIYVVDQDVTQGSIKFYCYYSPLSSGATVVDEQLVS